MKILYYDCFSGISGDMNLAAMIDLGVDPDVLRGELSKLGLDAEFSLRTARDSRKGIHGTRVDVVPAREHHDHDHHAHDGHGVNDHAHHDHERHAHHHHRHDHDHDVHEHHDHDHDAHEHHDHAHGAHDHHAHGPHDHEHRTLKDIEDLVNGADLDEAVKAVSLSMFRRVAEAEAKVHGTDLYKVHFHEVGAVDSIVDIVGAAVCFHALGVDAVWSSPVELGGGFVECAHGRIPVPAPATVEILTGIPTTRGAVQAETATPTGAAILAELADRFTAGPGMVVERTGYGVGQRDTDIPNVLRVHIAEVKDAPDTLKTVPASLLQCNIDDMTPETLGAVLDRLMEAGAMDVHFTSIVMKKNRPAVTLSLLCGVEDENDFKRLLFRHTSTLGVKSFPLEKTVLDIAFETLETPLGPVTMKNAIMDGRVLRSKPELEDCRELARRHDIPLHDVYVQIGRVRKH